MPSRAIEGVEALARHGGRLPQLGRDEEVVAGHVRRREYSPDPGLVAVDPAVSMWR